MRSDLWEKIESLYNSALQLAPEDREAFVVQNCSGDERLKVEVLALLASAEHVDSFMDEPVASLGLTILGIESSVGIGEFLDRYKILESLGQGGMGEVYLAHDPRLNRRVALKILPVTITEDRTRILRFQNEARAASSISHPNVAHIYEIGEAEGWHYITMEYVKGPTLRELLKHKRLTTALSLDIAAQVCGALSAAHKAGVIHRDIKPENIVVGDSGYVKVLDFGLAKLIEGARPELPADTDILSSLHSQPEMLMGTSHYISPEQIRRQRVDHRTDLWSLGVVIYEMLLQKRPFRGESFSEILVGILEQQADLSNLEGRRSPALKRMLRRCLSKDPTGRYQSADELLQELQKLGGRQSAELHIPPDRKENEEEPTARLPGSGMVSTVEQGRPQTIGERHDTVSGNTLPPPSVFTKNVLRKLSITVPLLLILLAGSYYWLVAHRNKPFQDREINLRFERLNLAGGAITETVISPDGKYVAYVVTDEGKQAVHVTELATLSDLRLTPSSAHGYSGLSFSPDGTFIYYLENHAQVGTLYRVSKLGGGQRKILEDLSTAVTFSPDGSRFAFVRGTKPNQPGELVVANSDGSSEGVVVKRTIADGSFFFTDTKGAGPAWSPDGEVIACPAQDGGKPRQSYLELIDAETGAAHKLGQETWSDIGRMAWLADSSGLIVAVLNHSKATWQLRLVSRRDGSMRTVSNDANNYKLISGTHDSSAFLTLNVENNSSVWHITVKNGTEVGLASDTKRPGISEVKTTGDGTLLYTISDGTQDNIWSLPHGAHAPIQLTFDSNNFRPTASADGRHVVFVSNRGGGTNIWRMDRDGTNMIRLTDGKYNDMPSITPDGNWVIYRTGVEIRKASIEGGESIKLFEKMATFCALSPDGRQLAIFASEGKDRPIWYLDVHDLETTARVKRFSLPSAVNTFNDVRWALDGKALSFVSSADGVSNIWVQPLSGGEPHQLSHFREGEIISFAWSVDGSELICVRRSKAVIPMLVRLF